MYGQPVQPVYNQLSTIRDDLVRGQMMGLSGGIGTTPVQSTMVSQILNPAPPPSPMVGSTLYETSIYGARIDAAASMQEAYRQNVTKVANAESTFNTVFGGISTAAFMSGHPILGLGISLLQNPVKNILQDVGIMPKPEPVFGTEELTRANIASQIHRVAFANLDPFATGGERGISVEQARNLAPDVMDFMRDQGFQGMEMGRLMQGAAGAGVFSGVENIRQITGRIKDYIQTISQFVRETGASLEEAGQVAAVGNRLGVGQSGMSDFMRNISVGANIGGISATSFMQMGAQVVQPFAQSGINLAPAFDALTWDTAMMRTMSNMGMVSNVAMQQMGGAAGAASSINQMAMNYWTSPRNLRRAAAMSMGGSWDATQMQQVIRGEGFADDYMDAYNNADINDRLRAQWFAQENIVANADLAAEAMIGTMFARMEDMDITDPIAQQQQLTRWGLSRAQAQITYAQHAAVGDPGLQLRAYNRSLLLQREQAVAGIRNTGRTAFRDLVAMGAVISHSGGDRRDLIQMFNEDFNSEYQGWAENVNLYSGSYGGAQYVNAAMGLPNLRGRSRIYAGTLGAMLQGFTAEERNMIGPQLASMFNEQQWTYDLPGGGDQSEAQKPFEVLWDAEREQFRYRGQNAEGLYVDITDDILSGNSRYFLEENVVDDLAQDVERVLDRAAEGVPGGPSTTLERIVPTRGQARIMASAYRANEAYRASFGTIPDMNTTLQLGPVTIPGSNVNRAMQDAALIPRLLTRGQIGTASEAIFGGQQGGRRREIYEQLASLGATELERFGGSFTAGITAGDTSAPLTLMNRLAQELHGENATFLALGATEQEDIINVAGVMFPEYATQTEELEAEATRKATVLAEQFTTMYAAQDSMSATERARRLGGLRGRISDVAGISRSEVTDTVLQHVSFLATATAGNMTTQQALDELGLTGTARETALNAYRASIGYMGMSDVEIANLTGGEDRRAQMSYVRTTLQESLQGKIVIGEEGRALTTADLDKMLRGESVGDVRFAGGVSEAFRERFGSLVEDDKLATELIASILSEQTDAVPGGESPGLGGGAFNMTGNMTVAASNVNVYTGADLTNISSLETGSSESTGASDQSTDTR